MRLFTLAALSVAALSFLASGTARAEWREESDGSWTFKADEPRVAKSDCGCGTGCTCEPGACPSACPVARSVIVPPGHHAHRTTDGRTIVHADTNVGNPAAHAGVAHPWPKTAFPGDTVTVGGSFAVADPCPNGMCPRAPRSTTAAAPASANYSHATASRGPVRGLFSRLAEWRANRPRLFGGARGCASCGQ